MNRASFFRTIAAFLAAPLAFSRRKPNVWDSPQGQYCLMLRAELERLGHFDDLREDWQEVTEALGRGHKLFWAWPSREYKTGGTSRMLFSVRPTSMAPFNIPPQWKSWTLAILPTEPKLKWRDE